MAAYNIIVNDIQKTENKFVCLARIDNYRNMLKHVSIGESITTEPFNINFDNSIGMSKWVLIFYPQGQYIHCKNATISGNGRVSMYLKMVACKNEDYSLMTSVKFFIKSPYFEMKDEYPCSRSATFLYRDLNKRWIGPFNLASQEKLYSQQCKNLFFNDCLTIGCEVVVTNSCTYIIRSPAWECLSKTNTDTDKQENANIIRRSNRYVQTDDIEEENKIKPYFTRSLSISLKKTKEENEWPYPGESNKKIKKISNYGFAVSSNQNTGTWHEKLLKSCNEKLWLINNENQSPNCQHNMKSKELSRSTKDVRQVSTNSGYA